VSLFSLMMRKCSLMVSISPRLRNRWINKLILARVVPTISDNSSCVIFSLMRVLCWSFLPMSGPTVTTSGHPLLAIHRPQISDDLLLVRNAHGQVAHEALKQRVAA